MSSDGWDAWKQYLKPIEEVADGCAVMTRSGQRYEQLTAGKWAASAEEERNYADILGNTATAEQKEITYAGNKYVIFRALDDTVMARYENYGLVIQRAKRDFLVAAQSPYGKLPDVAVQVNKLIRLLM